VSASKEVLKFSQSIIVDISQTSALPPVVKEMYLQGGASIPIVIFTDPGMENTYGRFNHVQMETQNYDLIFKNAKSQIDAALKAGTFIYGKGNEPQITNIKHSTIETWTSSQGAKIQAKLTRVENDEWFVFETASKKIIKITAAQLSKESAMKARQIANFQ